MNTQRKRDLERAKAGLEKIRAAETNRGLHGGHAMAAHFAAALAAIESRLNALDDEPEAVASDLRKLLSCL